MAIHTEPGYGTLRPESQLLTIAAVAAKLGVHHKTVRRFIREGRLPAVRLGASSRSPLRVDPAELYEFIYGSEGQ